MIGWRVSAETDLGAYLAQPWGHWDEGLPHVITQARLGLRLELHKYASLVASAAFGLFVERDRERVLEPGFDHGRRRLSEARSRTAVHAGPGWFVGLRF